MSRYVELGEGDNLDIDLSEIQAVVFPVEGEEVTIEPTTEEQVILPTSDKKLIKKATVKAVTSEIDENIKPENIVLGKTILGVQGNVAPDKPDQTKTTIPTKERQVVKADTGFELAENIVEPIPDEYVVPQGELLIDENNKTYDVKNYETAKVEITETPKGEFYVKVFDYDGTQLGKTVWLNNGDTYKLEIEPPTHNRLDFDQWICTQDIVDGVVTIDGNHVLIGATYVTTSGMNELEIELTPQNAPNIETDGFTVTLPSNATMNKYWNFENDQTTSDNLVEHTYYEYGKYIIAFEGTFTANYIFNQSSSNHNNFLVAYRARGRDNKNLGMYNFLFSYCDGLRFVSLSSYGITRLSVFEYCPRVECIVASDLSYQTRDCYSLKTVIARRFSGGLANVPNLENFVIPKGATSFNYTAVNRGTFNSIYVPEGVTSGALVTNNPFLKKIVLASTIAGTLNLSNCYNLTEIIGLENTKVTQFPGSMLQGNIYLKILTFPATFTSIGVNMFEGCVNIRLYDFSRCNQVVTLSNKNAFGGIQLDCKIVVPDALYDEWVVATNWNQFQGYIYKASEINNE